LESFFREFRDAGGVDLRKVDGLGFPFFGGECDVAFLGIPFRRAAEDRGRRDGDGFAGEHLDDGVARVERLHGFDVLEARVVDATHVAGLR